MVRAGSQGTITIIMTLMLTTGGSVWLNLIINNDYMVGVAADVILQHMDDITILDDDGSTILHHACKPDVVEQIIQR